MLEEYHAIDIGGVGGRIGDAGHVHVRLDDGAFMDGDVVEGAPFSRLVTLTRTAWSVA